MTPPRITSDQRQYLRDMVEGGTIDNVSAFAKSYAAREGLNPNTVRAMLVRLQREVEASKTAGLEATSSWLIPHILSNRELDDLHALVEVGAAVMVRCERDVEFRDLVTRRLAAFRELLDAFEHTDEVARNAHLNTDVIAALRGAHDGRTNRR